MRRASETERERLHETFAALCRIQSPSGHERACADWVAAELEAIGLEVHEDGGGPAVGSEAGNLLARIPGRDAASVLHLRPHGHRAAGRADRAGAHRRLLGERQRRESSAPTTSRRWRSRSSWRGG